IEKEIRARIRPGLELEIWDERVLSSLLQTHFGLAVGELTRRVARRDRSLEGDRGVRTGIRQRSAPGLAAVAFRSRTLATRTRSVRLRGTRDPASWPLQECGRAVRRSQLVLELCPRHS